LIDYQNFDLKYNRRNLIYNKFVETADCIIFMVNLKKNQNYMNEFIDGLQYLISIIEDSERNIPIILFGISAILREQWYYVEEEFDLEKFLSSIHVPPEMSLNVIKGDLSEFIGMHELRDYLYNLEDEKEDENLLTKAKNKLLSIMGKNEQNSEQNEQVNETQNKREDNLKVIYYLLCLKEKPIVGIGYNIETINDNNWKKLFPFLILTVGNKSGK